VTTYPEMPHVDGVRHRDVTVNGVRLHVAEAGEGEPVVMLHGWPQHWWEGRAQIPSLAERYRVICPDLRGFGWSEVPKEGFRPETFAADILHLFDELELDRVRLVGHDWGALTAFIICLRHPDRVERYLALNMIHPWLRLRPRLLPGEGARLWYQAAVAVPGLSPAVLPHATDFAARCIRASSGDESCWDDGVIEMFTDQLRDPDRARASSALYRWALSPRGWLALALGRYHDMRLRTPTLLLFGTRDFAIKEETLEGYEEHADDMRVEKVPGVGHFIADERPDLITQRALELFGATEPQQSASSRA